ncbi:cytochrome P450 [Phellopilus nigrolimitatus]|nr:cytochrome P450 [Phellopilus nigrolimitatus]
MSIQPSPAVSAWPRLNPFSGPTPSVAPKTNNHAIVIVGILLFASLYVLPELFGYKSLSVFSRKLYNKAGYCYSQRTYWPSDRSFPFLSHYPEMMMDYWYKRFGPLYSLWIGNQLFMVISDPGLPRISLSPNGVVTSSRKEMFIKSQTVFVGRGITATPYNDRWRKHRKIASVWLNQRAVDSYSQVLDYEATTLLKELYRAGNNPINPQPHAGRCSLNNMLTIAFASRTESVQDPLVSQALKLSREFMNCTGPVSNLVDFITPLQWFTTPLQARGKKLHQGLTMILSRESENLDDLDMAILASAFMIGGVETKKAQEELDRVVGRDRLPTIEDEKDLPYCHSNESTTLSGSARRTVASEDIVYKGQYIPKDTVLVLNTYSMHHNPERHPEPHKFNPERYINDHTNNTESANLPNAYERDNWMFGAGRRICPGMIVAEREIWLTISRMLWAVQHA